MEKKKSLAGSLITMIISFATIMLMLFPVIEIFEGIKVSFIDYVTIENLATKIVAFLSILVVLYAFVHSILTLVSYKLRVSKYAKIGWEILTFAGWLVFVPLVAMFVAEYIADIDSWAMWVIVGLMLLINIFASIFFGAFEAYKTYERKIVNKKLAIISLALMALTVVLACIPFFIYKGVNFEEFCDTIIWILPTILFAVLFLVLCLVSYRYVYNIIALVINIFLLFSSVLVTGHGPIILIIPILLNLSLITSLVMSIIMLVIAIKTNRKRSSKRS